MNDNIRQPKIIDFLLKDSLPDKDDPVSLLEKHTLLIDRGYEYVERGDLEKALEIFSWGIHIDESDPDSLNGLGITLYEMGRFKASRYILEKAAILHPDDPITMANLAGTCWEQGNFDEAIYYYSKSIELDHEIEETHLNLINLYLETGALFMAFMACTLCMKIFPDNTEAKELMDEIILSLGVSMF